MTGTIIAAVLAFGTATNIKVPGTMIAAQLDKAFAGVQMELESDHRSKDGSVMTGGRLRSDFAGKEEEIGFSVPDYQMNLGWLGSVSYRLHGVRLTGVKSSATANDFVIVASFASSGHELVGSHSLLGDAAVPDIGMTAMQAEVHLKPTLTKSGRISYEDPSVQFHAKMQSQGLTFKLRGQEIDVLDRLTGYRRTIESRVSGQLLEFLNDPVRKEAICEQIDLAFRDRLRPLGGHVSNLEWSGTDLLVTLER